MFRPCRHPVPSLRSQESGSMIGWDWMWQPTRFASYMLGPDNLPNIPFLRSTNVTTWLNFCKILCTLHCIVIGRKFFQIANQNHVYNVKTGSLKRNSSYIRPSAIFFILTQNWRCAYPDIFEYSEIMRSQGAKRGKRNLVLNQIGFLYKSESSDHILFSSDIHIRIR